MTPPWGVPEVVEMYPDWVSTPAFSHLRMSPITSLSSTCFSTSRNRRGWERLSKKETMSNSATQRSPRRIASLTHHTAFLALFPGL